MSIETINHVFQSLEKQFTPAIPSVPQQPMPGSPALVERPDGSSPTAGIRTADAGPPYKLECRARYYDAASRILEEEGQLCTHDNTNELGTLIEQWINDARNNWEPR